MGCLSEQIAVDSCFAIIVVRQNCVTNGEALVRNTLTLLPSPRHLIWRYSGRSLPFALIKLCRLLPGRRSRDGNSKYYGAASPLEEVDVEKNKM